MTAGQNIALIKSKIELNKNKLLELHKDVVNKHSKGEEMSFSDIIVHRSKVQAYNVMIENLEYELGYLMRGN